MIAWVASAEVHAFARPVDMRKSFDSLARLVELELGRAPVDGGVFLFVNARCNRAKALCYDGTGLRLFAKRLERGRFAAPWKRAHEGSVMLSGSELALFFEGSPFVFMGRLSPERIEPGRVATSNFSMR